MLAPETYGGSVPLVDVFSMLALAFFASFCSSFGSSLMSHQRLFSPGWKNKMVNPKAISEFIDVIDLDDYSTSLIRAAVTRPGHFHTF